MLLCRIFLNLGEYMKNCKHYLLFLLAGALLVLPVTQHYAMSWDDIRGRISNFFSGDILQKVVPGTIITLGLVGAMYYWWTRKKGGDDSGKSGGITSLPPRIEPTVSEPEVSPQIAIIPSYTKPTVVEQKVSPRLEVSSLQQFQVYSQFNWDGGGAASCGYQTLLRGMQVVNAQNEHESDEVLQKILNDSIPIAVYFGENGEWRKDIIARRKDQELKKILHAKFIATLNQYCDDKSKDLYKSALGFLEDTIVVISRDPQERIKQYEFTDESIQSDVAKSLEQLKNEANESLIEKLQLPDMINHCFDLEAMRKELFSKEFILSLPKLIQELHNRYDLQEDFAGDWLSDGELEYLWTEHRVDIIPLRVNCGFKAIANFELVDNPEYPKEFDEVAVYIDENVKPLLNKQQQMFQIFALGTMRQTGSTTGTRGHWYPLVMYQDQTGKRHYYIMDSAGNASRTNDTNAWKIVNLIEKAAR